MKAAGKSAPVPALPTAVYRDSMCLGDEDDEGDDNEEGDEDSVSEAEDASSFDEMHSELDDEIYEACEEEKRGAACLLADSWESSDDDDDTVPPVKSKPLSLVGEALNCVSLSLLVLFCFCYIFVCNAAQKQAQ